MLDNLLNQREYGPEAKAMSSEFFVQVYTYMFIALGISGAIAYMCGNIEFALKYFLEPTVNGGLKATPLFWVVALAPVGFGLLIQMAYQRLSMVMLIFLFGVYAVLMGLGLSTIFLVYSGTAIFSTFIVTAGAYAAMAIIGATTKTDLSKMGSVMWMLFIGIFLAGIMNIFIKSDGLSFIIALIGVVVFTGLTAWEMQRLKYIGEDPQFSQMDRQKLAIVGGLTLYILFINLFLSLLRLLGSRE